MPPPDDATLAQWETCHYRVLRVAAAITRQAQRLPPRTRITSSRELAVTLDTSAATVNRAKRFLADTGVITRGGNRRYYTT